jgi:hypothetical protein
MYLHVDKRSFMMRSSISAGCTTGPAVRTGSTITLTRVCQVDETSFHQLISWWFTKPYLARLVARAAEGCGRRYWFSSSRHDRGMTVLLLAQLLQRPLLQIFSLMLLQQFQRNVIRLTPFRTDNICTGGCLGKCFCTAEMWVSVIVHAHTSIPTACQNSTAQRVKLKPSREEISVWWRHAHWTNEIQNVLFNKEVSKHIIGEESRIVVPSTGTLFSECLSCFIYSFQESVLLVVQHFWAEPVCLIFLFRIYSLY